jgi:hypothetical protein
MPWELSVGGMEKANSIYIIGHWGLSKKSDGPF